MKICTTDRFHVITAIILVSAVILPAQRPDKPLNYEYAVVSPGVSSPEGKSMGKSGRAYSELQKGLATARRALENKKCAALFGDLHNTAFETPFDVLNTYSNNNLIRVGKSDPNGGRFRNADVGAVTVHGMGSFTNASGASESASVITINEGGFYFGGRTSDSSYVASHKGHGFDHLDMSDVRGAVIIHELLHAMGRIPDDSIELLKDGGKQSTANSELVRTSCFR